jgi:hypothetical protein
VLKAAIGRDVKGWMSLVLYSAGILFTLVDHRISYLLYVAVALMWLIPDRRIEHEIDDGKAGAR